MIREVNPHHTPHAPKKIIHKVKFYVYRTAVPRTNNKLGAFLTFTKFKAAKARTLNYIHIQ